MKYLIITVILLIVVALILRRLKPYLIVARQMFGVVQTARRMNNGIPPNFPERGCAPARESEKLERCRACGTWTPASRLTRDGYCSDCGVEVKKSESSKADFR